MVAARCLRSCWQPAYSHLARMSVSRNKWYSFWSSSSTLVAPNSGKPGRRPSRPSGCSVRPKIKSSLSIAVLSRCRWTLPDFSLPVRRRQQFPSAPSTAPSLGWQCLRRSLWGPPHAGWERGRAVGSVSLQFRTKITKQENYFITYDQFDGPSSVKALDLHHDKAFDAKSKV